MAPEVVRHGKYTVSADTFSWAMIVNELFTEEKPYEFLIPLEAAVGVVKRGLRPSQKRIKCERLRSVIAAAWDQDPAHRPAWPEIIAELEAARMEMSGVAGSRPPKHSISTRRPGTGAAAARGISAASLGQQALDAGAGAAAVSPASGSSGRLRGGGSDGSVNGKPTIGSLFRKLGTGSSGSGKSKREKGDKSKRAGHQLPMDTEYQA